MYFLDKIGKFLYVDEIYVIVNSMFKFKYFEFVYFSFKNESVFEIFSGCFEFEFLDLRGCWEVDFDKKFL